MTYASVISLHQLNIAVIAVLVLLVLLVLVLSLAKARSTWLHRRAALRQQAESAQNLRPVGQRGLLVDRRQGNGVPEELIKLLGQVVAYEAAKVGRECESERECIVCLGEYNEGDMVRVLDACHHMFHQDCIDAWLKAHNSCPICRTVLLPSRASPNPVGSEGGQHTHSHHHHSHHHHSHHHHPHHHHHHDPEPSLDEAHHRRTQSRPSPDGSLVSLDQSHSSPDQAHVAQSQVHEMQRQSSLHDSITAASPAGAAQAANSAAGAEGAEAIQG
ncbi:hypothetical protein CLOP_g10 [Closterium sp. NIES-67]|nr:hypothetical protein CLOP_g10 [Closterium sp. NIES-67]